MAKTLYDISKLFRHIETDNDLDIYDFYFWPGYDSILRPPNDRRVALVANGRQSGMGWIEDLRRSTPDRLAHYKVCDIQIWFSILLSPHTEDRLSDDDFSPGGTHAWTVRSKKPPRLKEGVKEVPLTVIEIGVFDNPTPNVITDTDYGLITIALRKDELENCGHSIAAQLNNVDQITHDLYWPCPQDNYPIYRTDDQSSIGESSKQLQCIREQLYSIWLTSGFNADWKNSCYTWPDSLLSELDRLGLKKVVSEARSTIEEKRNPHPPDDATTNDHQYRFWYTIILEKVVSPNISRDNTEAEELGSAMLFSSHRLRPEFFVFVKPWIEWIYLLMRQFENAISLQRQAAEKTEQSRIAAVASYARGASHSLKNAVTLPLWRLSGAAQLQKVFEEPGGWAEQMKVEGFGAEVHRIAGILRRSALAEADIEFLRRQTETMFWIMDPDRMRDELIADQELVTWSLVSLGSLLSLASAAAVRKLSRTALNVTSTDEKDSLTRSVLAASEQLIAIKDKQNQCGDLDYFSAVLTNALDRRVDCQIVAEPVRLTRSDFRVAENVAFELIVNGMARSISAARYCKSLFTFKVSNTDIGFHFEIENTASITDGETLIQNWENCSSNDDSDSGSRGVSGLYQIQLLCQRAEQAKQDEAAKRGTLSTTRLGLRSPSYDCMVDCDGFCLVHTGISVWTISKDSNSESVTEFRIKSNKV